MLLYLIYGTLKNEVSLMDQDSRKYITHCGSCFILILGTHLLYLAADFCLKVNCLPSLLPPSSSFIPVSDFTSLPPSLSGASRLCSSLFILVRYSWNLNSWAFSFQINSVSFVTFQIILVLLKHSWWTHTADLGTGSIYQISN